jgi:hypothetical protein
MTYKEFIKIRPHTANFQREEAFYKFFKRKPKQWSLEQLDDLRIRSAIRSKKRWEDLYDYIDVIVEKVPKNKFGRHVVYFEDNGKIRQYEFHEYYNHQTEKISYGFSCGDVCLKSRKELLYFLLLDENCHMGNNFKNLRNLCTIYGDVVHIIFCDVLYSKLHKHFKKIKQIPPPVFTICIGKNKYYIKTVNDHGSIDSKFELVSISEHDNINISDI